MVRTVGRTDLPTGRVTDFDFLIGNWTVDHRRLGGVANVEEDHDDGEPIGVRFEWRVLDADHARWPQAFTRDGNPWETNWVMDFARR